MKPRKIEPTSPQKQAGLFLKLKNIKMKHGIDRKIRKFESIKSTIKVLMKNVEIKKAKLKPPIIPLTPSMKLYKLTPPTNNIAKNTTANQSTNLREKICI